MKKYLVTLLSLILLTSCQDELTDLTLFTNSHGGTFAVRIVDQVAITEHSFTLVIKVENLDNGYIEKRIFNLERMNFHPFKDTFEAHQMEGLHFEYYNFPQDTRDTAYEFLSKWDLMVKNNQQLFKVTETLVFALCQKQKVPKKNQVVTIFKRQNKPDGFEKIYDDLTRFKNRTTPLIAYQKSC